MLLLHFHLRFFLLSPPHLLLVVNSTTYQAFAPLFITIPSGFLSQNLSSSLCYGYLSSKVE